MTAIGNDTVLADSYTLLYGILTDQITDTNSSARAGSDFIFSAWPNRGDDQDSKNRKKWVDYPIVVLTTDITAGKNFTLKAGMRDWEVGVLIDVFNKSQKDTDMMMDEIDKTLQNNQLALAGSGLKNFFMESMSTSDFTDRSDALVHQKTLSFRYEYRSLNG